MFMLWAIKFILGININLPPVDELMVLKRGLHKISKREKRITTDSALGIEKDVCPELYKVSGNKNNK